MKKTSEPKKPRQRANRFCVRIRIEVMSGEFINTDSKYMTDKQAQKERQYWLLNGHPEAVVIEDKPEEVVKVGRMSGK